MYNERPLTSDSDFYLIKEHEYVRRYKLSNLHYHSEFELIYVKKGCVRFFINHKIYDVRTGSVIFINSNIIHRTECAENNTVNIILQFKNPVDSAYALRYISGFISEVIFVGKVGQRQQRTPEGDLIDGMFHSTTSLQIYGTFYAQ